MLTKTLHSIRGMFERLLNMYKEKVDKGSSRSDGCIRMRFIWPLLGLLAASLDPAFRKARGCGQRCGAWRPLSTSLLTSYR